jgi:hypothetical protein
MTDIDTITKTINLIFVAGPQASMLGACNIWREREREIYNIHPMASQFCPSEIMAMSLVICSQGWA